MNKIDPTTFGKTPAANILSCLLENESPMVCRKVMRVLGNWFRLITAADTVQGNDGITMLRLVKQAMESAIRKDCHFHPKIQSHMLSLLTAKYRQRVTARLP